MPGNPHIRKFKVNGQISKFPKNRRLDPQVYIVGIFSCPIRSQQKILASFQRDPLWKP